jgi:F-box/WD-40 domain protein MET30
MPPVLPSDTASTSIDPHTALMHGHDHEGLSERTRHSHGDSVEDDERKSKKMGELITPYLARHIPPQYNPLGGDRDGRDVPQSPANTKFCYRHRPDMLCRREADGPTMDELQAVSISSANLLRY